MKKSLGCFHWPFMIIAKVIKTLYKRRAFNNTVAINELLCMKNAGAQIAMDFSYNEGLAPMAIEKNQNSGGRFGATSQFSLFTVKMGQMD